MNEERPAAFDAIRRGLLLLLLPSVAWWGVGLALADPAGYRVQGSVTQTVYNATGGVATKDARTFTAYVSSTHWWIRTEATPEAVQRILRDGETARQRRAITGAPGMLGAGSGLWSTEWESNGDALLVRRTFLCPNDMPGMAGLRPVQGLGFASEQVEIFQRSVPTRDTDLCFPVWLEFCSPSTFTNTESYSAPIIWMGNPPRGSNDTFKVTAKPRHTEIGAFMEELTFVNPGFGPEYVNMNGGYSLKWFGPAGSHEYVQARLYPHTWVSNRGTVFPASSYLDEFSLPIGRPRQLVQRAVISVTSLALAQGEPFSIRPNGFVGVTDHRIMTRVGPLHYVTTNAFIRPGSLEAAGRSVLMEMERPNYQPPAAEPPAAAR